MTAAEKLLGVAVKAKATDVLLSPGNLATGNLHMRAGFENVYSRPTPSEALENLAREFVRMAGMPEECPPHETQLGSFEYGPVRVRLTRTRTEAGSQVRLRLQSVGLLEEALQEFRQGAYGGSEVRPFLDLPQGLLVVTGKPSAGKTSALSHLLADLSDPLVISEAVEIGSERLNPKGLPDLDIVSWAEEMGASRPVSIDEMEEQAKLRLARWLARSRLTLATVTAPKLSAAVHKLLAAPVPSELVVGLLQVSWKESPRVPAYTWYPCGEGSLGRCPVCQAPRPESGKCPGCSLPPVPRFLDRAVLRRMSSPEGYRALERLEEEWHA